MQDAVIIVALMKTEHHMMRLRGMYILLANKGVRAACYSMGCSWWLFMWILLSCRITILAWEFTFGLKTSRSDRSQPAFFVGRWGSNTWLIDHWKEKAFLKTLLFVRAPTEVLCPTWNMIAGHQICQGTSSDPVPNMKHDSWALDLSQHQQRSYDYLLGPLY